MKCPTADKLSRYVDDLITKQEKIEIDTHLISCNECRRVIRAFTEEQLFIKETLQTPTLPNDFASLILDQLEPYEQNTIHRKKNLWKRIILSVAGVVLAVGLSAALNPIFAQWLGGLFSTDRVDEGLKMAMEAGFAERINQEVTDNGITFKIEDIVADSSRVALSYQILDKNGKLKNTHFDFRNGKNEILAIDDHGKRLDISSMGWINADEYGLIEFSLREHQALEHLTLKFNLTELNGKKGNWQLDVPIDLKESLAVTKTVQFKDFKTSQHGVSINMKEVRFAPSSSELFYETKFTKEELTSLEANIQKLENQYGEKIVHTFTNYGTAIQYHIENEEKKAVSHHNTFFEGHPSDSGLLQGSGRPMGEIGHYVLNDSFIPQQDDHQLTFVLDGIFKTEPTDFSIKIKPKELKQHPISFEYEGNFMTIKEAKKHSKYSLRRSLFPIRKETIFKIEMEGGKQAPATGIGTWVLVDNKGNAYFTYSSGSISDDKDENDRYKTTVTIITYELDDIPEELTLHLLSATRYYEVTDKWKVPLY